MGLIANTTMAAVRACVTVSGLDAGPYEARLEELRLALEEGNVDGFFEGLNGVYTEFVVEAFPEFNPPPYRPEELGLASIRVSDAASGEIVKDLETRITFPEDIGTEIIRGSGQINFVGLIGDKVRVDVGFTLSILGLYQMPITLYSRDIELKGDLTEVNVEVSSMAPWLEAKHLPTVFNYIINIIIVAVILGLAYKLLKRLF